MNFAFPIVSREFYIASAPILILLVASMVAMLLGVAIKVNSYKPAFLLVLVSLLAAILCLILAPTQPATAYMGGGYLAGNVARFGQGLILSIGLFLVLLFRDSHQCLQFFRGEIISLFLMVLSGMLVMVASDDFVTLFVALELASIGLYALIGYMSPSRKSQEAAIKYFVLGSLAAAILLYGFALLYASVGSMRISEVVAALSKHADHMWLKLGCLMTAIGLAFKLALAPFHLWAPDAYEGAPTGITALMATTVKVMILVVALRFFGEGFSTMYQVWLPAMTFVAILSMILGNIMALVQTSLKRMLAYSSIAHSGYMAVAICALSGTSTKFPLSAILFYLVGYIVVSLGAFGVLMWLERDGVDNLTLDDLSGLASKHPWASFALATFMFSFSGMPPTVGFMGKFFVFNAAISNHLYGIVVIGAIGSTISLYYYLRVIVRMYMTERPVTASALSPQRSMMTAGLLALALILTLMLGTILPGHALEHIKSTAGDLARQ